ncbi:MAG: uroporphyrinogen decarboxylase family protein [Spirochaetia bacterium]|jgi:uroporphyrinogen decarboxylase
MTSRERVLAAVRREEPDRVPRDLSWGLTPAAYELFTRKTGQTDPLAYFKVDTRLVSQPPTRDPARHARYHGKDADVNEWGVANERGSDPALHFTHIVSPLRGATTIEDIVDYPLPDLDADYRIAGLACEVARLHEQGFAAAAPVATTIYEVAWQIRGLEELLTDMVSQPEMAECLFDRLTALRAAQAAAYARAGCDVLMLGDDVSAQNGMIMSPAMWRRFFKPRLARIINDARAAAPGIPVFYHTDGDCRAIIEELIEIGVTILNPVQPECMDPAELKRSYGSRLAFWGTIGIQGTLPFGSPDDVRREVKRRIDTVGAGGGLLLGPSHMIEPEVPWENLVALYDAIDEYGAY